jgi:hypothetical protein
MSDAPPELVRGRWHLRAVGNGAVGFRSYPSFLQAYRAALPLLRDGHELEAIDERSLAEHRPGIPLGLRHGREFRR